MRLFIQVLAVCAFLLGAAGCEPKPPKPKLMKTVTAIVAAFALAATAYAEETHNAPLSLKVKTALAADVGLKTLKIDVDTKGNTVTLKGAVDSADTKRRAEEVARKVKGVEAVKNELKVRGS